MQMPVTCRCLGCTPFRDLRNVVHERKGASPSVFAGLALGSAAAVAAAAAAAAQAAALAALAAAQAEAAGLSPAAAQAAAAASQGGQGGQGKEDEEKNPKWLPFLSLPLVRPQDNEELAPVRFFVNLTFHLFSIHYRHSLLFFLFIFIASGSIVRERFISISCRH